jgi:predicted phage tail protein
MNATRHRLVGRTVAALKRVFGAFALLTGVIFTGRVSAAFIHGLTVRQLWLAGALGLALILVGVVYLRTPFPRP